MKKTMRSDPQNEPFRITGPGFYRQRDGGRAEVVGRAKGKSVYCWVGVKSNNGLDSWTNLGRGFEAEEEPTDLIAPWTEPKLRPWRREEVPIGAAIRAKNAKIWHLIVEVNAMDDSFKAGISFVGDSMFAFESCEYSLDGGRTFLPCGIMEESK